jgi:hypothetical protein
VQLTSYELAQLKQEGEHAVKSPEPLRTGTFCRKTPCPQLSPSISGACFLTKWGIDFVRELYTNRMSSVSSLSLLLMYEDILYWELRNSNSTPSNSCDSCASASAFFPLLVPVLLAFASFSFFLLSFSASRSSCDCCFGVDFGARKDFEEGGNS